ncbi:MAG: thiamine pyrophosphate-dependent enzyme [Dethiobacteria bacterium]|jgi:pyruvate/2-oxoacid:ferredoxin oxidoreductase beta subunit
MLHTLVGDFARKEFMLNGHNGCAGCGPALAVRYLVKVSGQEAVIVIPASCWSIISGVEPFRSLETVVLHCPFPSAASTGAGIKKGLEAVGDTRTQVIVLAGDGATFDIGLQGLSGVAERNEDLIYVCYDNEAYMNTGTQRSSASPYGSLSTTTPAPRVKSSPKKEIMKIMAAHRIPYAATATVAYPGDLVAKMRRAMQVRGFRFLHIFTPCMQGWGSPVEFTVRLSRLAVLTRLFPLYEVEDGVRYRISYFPEEYIPVQDYLQGQKRFSYLEEQQIEMLQKNVDRGWQELCQQAGVEPTLPEDCPSS